MGFIDLMVSKYNIIALLSFSVLLLLLIILEKCTANCQSLPFFLSSLARYCFLLIHRGILF